MNNNNQPGTINFKFISYISYWSSLFQFCLFTLFVLILCLILQYLRIVLRQFYDSDLILGMHNCARLGGHRVDARMCLSRAMALQRTEVPVQISSPAVDFHFLGCPPDTPPVSHPSYSPRPPVRSYSPQNTSLSVRSWHLSRLLSVSLHQGLFIDRR